MKKLMIMALVVAMTTQTMFANTASTYTDVEGHWAKSEITEWSDLGVLKGSDGQFRPDEDITRGELAVVLDRVMDYQEVATNNFTDLENGQFYTDAILKANQAGIIKGSDSLVRPTDKITREEAAVMITRALGLDLDKTATSFSDNSEISTWAVAEVAALADKDIIAGQGDNMFAPKANITRAEVVKMLDSAIKYYIIQQAT